MLEITYPYKVLEKVGEGAMSEVFKAIDPNGNIVALKILRQFLKDNTDCIERINKEADVLNKLDDEKIVKSLGIEKTHDCRLMLVQEFVDGKNLEVLFNQISKEPIPVIGAILVSEILLGLEEAHRQGIIHRDLKPENIIITSRGNIKIADFGVAKNLESQELTLTGVMLGSPAYMSPEQIKNQPVDGRSDIFGLGVLLYQLATGELPFLANNYAQLIKSIEQDEYKAPIKVNKNIHPELSKIIKKALAKNPEDRYQKVYEFRFDLLNYLDLLAVQNQRRVLKDFFYGNIEKEEEVQKKLVRTIITRAQKAKQEGSQKEAIDLLAQALTIEPTNLEVRQLFQDAHHSSFDSKKLFLMIFIFIFLLGGFVWLDQYLQKQLDENNFQEQAQALIKPVTPPRPMIISAPIQMVDSSLRKEKNNSVSSLITPVQKATAIVFNVDEDVIVFLDDNEVARPYGGKVALNAGKHLLRLEKSGFTPISSYVNVPRGEVTTINAKTHRVIP